MKTLPARLDPELYDRLKRISEIRGTSMAEVVREALRAYLPTVAREEAAELEGRARRLRALAEADPDYMDQPIAGLARAEAEHPDPLEEDLVIMDSSGEVLDEPSTEAAESEVTERVKDVLTGMG